ncbi:tyrosine-protein phosphatase non-receptor type 18 [Morphnus guianensis]
MRGRGRHFLPQETGSARKDRNVQGGPKSSGGTPVTPPPRSRACWCQRSPPHRPPAMDATYAVVNKTRRGGGAGGRDSTPFGRDATSFDRDHAPFGKDPAPPGTSPSLPGSPLRHPSPTLAASPRPGDGAYEVVTPHGDPGSTPCLGFNFRIGKPKGPREPPAEWSRV